ncbi:MAG: SCP2 sterol-binding domain-containing protein [Lachnospiraceae bacterium]|nr:SCP2 sterol-binding domain-containing protein [Lachnospiraceae bacterium]
MTYAEFFQEIKSRFMGTDVSDIYEHLAYQFCIDDEEAGGIFYVEVKDGILHVEPYEYYDKHANFICDTDTLIKIADGKLDPVKAYTANKLRVEGDIDKALRLKEIIDHKKRQEKEAAKKAAAEKKAAEKEAAKKAAAEKKAVAKKTTTKAATEKKAVAKKTTTKTAEKKTTATKTVTKAAEKKTTAKKTAGTTAKKASTKKTTDK